MAGAGPDVQVQSSGSTTIHTLPATNPAGVSDTAGLPFQGITGGVPVPVSLASVPAAPGVSTAAKQPAFGTAGTPSPDVITVQGVTSMTPLKVDGSGVTQPVSVASGLTVIGRTSNPSATPAITSGSAYTSGQEAGALMTFAIGGAGSGILESVFATCKSVQTMPLKLYIFDANPSSTTWTDKSIPAINVADVPKLLGLPLTLSVADSGLGTHTVWGQDGIGRSFIGANLYGVLLVSGTPTFASTSDITVKLGVVDD
jgi:hypothetical protein